MPLFLPPAIMESADGGEVTKVVPSKKMLTVDKDKKSPFEKMKSPAEARVLYAGLARDKQEFFCKGEGPLFSFTAQAMEPTQGLLGQVLVIEDRPLIAENVVVNFNSGKDRYYTLADFTPLPNGKGRLQFNDLLYRLERREHFRVPLSPKIIRDCNVISCDGKSYFVAAVVLDMSVGGARIQILKAKIKNLKEGSKIRCVLHIKDKWNFELTAEVRHITGGQKTEVLGVRFEDVNPSTERKLVSLIMELQREAIRERAHD